MTKPCSSGSTASAIARAGLHLGPAPHRTQILDAVIGQDHAQALERACARAGDQNALAGRELAAQMLPDGIEQVEIRARPLGSEVARAPTTQIERGAGARIGRRRERHQIEALAPVQQPGERVLAKVELVRRQRPVRGGAHGARRLGRLAARRIVLADGLVPALERGLAQVVEPDDALRRPDSR